MGGGNGTARFGLFGVFSAVIVSAAIVVVMGAFAGDARASRWDQLIEPWPKGQAVESKEGRAIRFPTTSPFAPDDLDDPKKATGVGTLYLPTKKEKKQAPIVILLHGSAGVRDAREHTYGRQFAAMGIAAVVVDVFAARYKPGQGFVGRLINSTETMMLADAFAALRWASTKHPVIDPDRVLSWASPTVAWPPCMRWTSASRASSAKG